MTTTTNKSLNEPASGSFNWDTPLNTNFSYLDQAFGSTTNLNPSSGGATLTSTQYIPLILKIGNNTPSTNPVTYTIPSGVGGQWIIINNVASSNTQAIVFASGGGGTSVTVPNGGTVTAIVSDGTNIYPTSITSVSGGTTGLTYTGSSALTMAGTLNVANGGTGRATLTANSLLSGDGTNAVALIAPGASGNILTSDGTYWVSTTPAVVAQSQIQSQVFTSGGSWVAPSGVTKVRATVIAGGAGGYSSNVYGGGGGAAMGLYTVVPTTSYTVTVGAGGAINTAGNPSSFASFLSATGGSPTPDNVNPGLTGVGTSGTLINTGALNTAAVLLSCPFTNIFSPSSVYTGGPTYSGKYGAGNGGYGNIGGMSGLVYLEWIGS